MPNENIQNNQNQTATWWQYALALFIPIIGVIIAIMFFARGAASQGVAMLLTSAVGVFLTLALIGGA